MLSNVYIVYQDVACKKWSKRCSKKQPILPASGRQDFPAKEISQKDLEMEKLMKSMKDMGMGGMSMYNRDDMDEMANDGGMGGDEDMYGDDNSEFGAPPSEF